MTSDSIAMPIAVVGIGCRLPCNATNPSKLWDMLLGKKSARRETPPDRFNVDAFHHPDPNRNGTTNNRGGHYLSEDVSAFDATFFNISPAEAMSLDPMQRLLLEVVYESTENAGIPLSKLSGTNTSCFVGSFMKDYDELERSDQEMQAKYMSVGTNSSMLSNRISFFFDLKGPSATVDTACSSSLFALHLACQGLRTGETRMAIVGGTNLILSPLTQIAMSNMHFLSPDSISYAFDERANGYARGEGMAALILKPLHLAIQDGDPVRAVIRSTASNSDGRTPGITMPSKEAQVALIRTAYEAVGCDFSRTGYFEAHGTGTVIGDPIEAGAVGEVFASHRPQAEDGSYVPLYVGSIKTNVGHLEGASGLAGMIKAILAVEKGIIPPNIWFEKGNPAIDFQNWGIKIPTEAFPWPFKGVRRASVNSFGYGGSNVHVVLEDATSHLQYRNVATSGSITASLQLLQDTILNRLSAKPIITPVEGQIPLFEKSRLASEVSVRPELEQRTSQIFHISAHEEDALKEMARRYAEYLENSHDQNSSSILRDLEFTLNSRRSHLDYRSSVVATNTSQLCQQLRSLPSISQISQHTPRVAFIFTGQGAQWWAMGRELLRYTVFIRCLDACEVVVKELGAEWSLTEELLKDEQDSRINDATISQPLCTALQLGLVDLFASWGILPNKVVGHSSGEIAAAYAAGALSLESAMVIAYFRGTLSSKVKKVHAGSMLAVGLAREELETLSSNVGKICIACINSPNSVTLSGDASAIDAIRTSLMSRGIFARKLQVDTAYHSHHMHVVQSEYYEQLLQHGLVQTEFNAGVKMFSSVSGKQVNSEDLGPRYWVENMTSPVLFSKALSCLLRDNEVSILVEIGPHSALAGPCKQIIKAAQSATGYDEKTQYFSALIRGKPADLAMLETAAVLHTRGVSVNLFAANHPESRSPSIGPMSQLPAVRSPRVVTDLPTYPWNHTKKHWFESRLSRDYRFRPFPRTNILGAPVTDWNPHEPRWRNILRVSEQPWLKDHTVSGTVIYPAAGFLAMALQAARQIGLLSQQAPTADLKLKEVSISHALVIPDNEEGVEVSLSVHSQPVSCVSDSKVWKEFRIFSWSSSAEVTEHCRGLLSVVSGTEREHEELLRKDPIAVSTLKDARAACTIGLKPKQLYASLVSVGIHHGPCFQGVTGISVGQTTNQAIGTVSIQLADSVGTQQWDSPIHPTTLDSILQTLVPALNGHKTVALKRPFVPTFFHEVSVVADIDFSVGATFEVVAQAISQGSRTMKGHITAFDPTQSKPVAQIQGFICTAMSGSSNLPVDVRKLCYRVVTEPDIDLIDREALYGVLQSVVPPHHDVRVEEFERLAYYFVEKVLQEVIVDEVDNMPPHLQKLLNHFSLQYQNARSTGVLLKFHDATTSHGINRLIQNIQSNATDYEGQMLLRMGQDLPRILRQDIDPLGLMTEDNLLEDYYSVSAGVWSTYAQLGRYMTLLSHKYPDLSYIEIGAGTGGATVPILEALSGVNGLHSYPRFKSYTYTDVSTGFFERAQRRFDAWPNLMNFRKLDIELDPSMQDYEEGKFDVVVAANALHATCDIDKTLQNVRKLLRPGGKLVLLENCRPRLFFDVIMGGLAGWWNSSEEWRQNRGPLLNEAQWRDKLKSNGFSDLEVDSPDVQDSEMAGTRLMVATAVEPSSTAEGAPTTSHTGMFIIQNEDDMILQEYSSIAETFKNTMNDIGIGISAELVTMASIRHRSLSGIICVSFVELLHPSLINISAADFELLKRITQESAGLIWVTRGASSVSPELSLFHGMARVICSENEGFPCITVDLDGRSKLDVDNMVKMLSELIKGIVESPLGVSSRESEYVEKDGILHIKRVVEDTGCNDRIQNRTNFAFLPPEYQELCPRSRPMKMTGELSNDQNQLLWEDDRTMSQSLGDDEVEIEVQAAGLNTDQILTITSDSSGVKLGNECAGSVTKVGVDVRHLQPGDRVVAWCLGCFSTHARAAADCVLKIPTTMSLTTAASLPVVYSTAFYALDHIARLRNGEKVLVHCADEFPARFLGRQPKSPF